MTISFNQINTAGLNAGVFTETNRGPQSGAYGVPKRLLIIDTATAASTGPKLAVTQVFDPEDGHKKWGYGTPTGAMVEEVLSTSQGINCYVIASSDTAGTAATKTITFTGGPTTGAGIVKGKIGGYAWQGNVPSGSTITEIAAIAVAAINAKTKLPMTAANAAGVLTATVRWKGASGNNVKITDVSIAATDGASIGVTVAVADGVTGATDPDLTAAIAVLQATDLTFTQIVTSYTGDTQLDLIDGETVRRRVPEVARRGAAYVCVPGSQGTVTTWKADRADNGMIGIASGTGPGLPWVYAAHVAALRASEADVLRSSLRKKLPARIPVPSRSEAVSHTQRNSLAALNISSLVLNENGALEVEILRMLGNGDDVVTWEALGVVENDLNKYLDDQLLGKRIVAEAKTPKEDAEISTTGIAAVVRGRIISALGRYFTDPDAVADTVIVEQDGTNTNAVNISFSGEIAKIIYRVHVKYTFT